MPENLVDNKERFGRREEYVARINRVLDYIEANYNKNLSLKKLASVASFSPFHFHRIFSAMMGETLNHFIQRLRLEKAATLLIVNPKKSITEIALDCGFSGSAAFARAFKGQFQMSAGQWRAGGGKNSNIRKTDSNQGNAIGNDRKEFIVSTGYVGGANVKITWRIAMPNKSEVKVEVRNFEEMHVAYVRHIGPYKGDAKLFEGLFGKLMKWAGPRGLLGSPDAKIMAVYHDNPDLTDQDKLRTSICLTAPKDTEVDGEIGKMTISGGQYAVAHFELHNDEYEQAWKAIFGGWLPESGYQPDERPCFEMFLGDPKDHPEGKCVVDICVPVKPL